MLGDFPLCSRIKTHTFVTVRTVAVRFGSAPKQLPESHAEDSPQRALRIAEGPVISRTFLRESLRPLR